MVTISNESLSNHKYQNKLIISILLLALMLRLIWVLSVPTQPISDFKEFDRLAVSLINGQGYVNGNGLPTAYRAPGYVFLMAGIYSIFGHFDLVVRLANVLLGVLTCWLTYILTIDLFDHRTGLISALIMAGFPSLIAWTNILASENMFIPVVLGIFITFLKGVKSQTIRWWWIILCGILSGVGVLTRPAALLLPGILMLALVLQAQLKIFSVEWIKGLAKPVIIGLVLYLIVFASILPWSIRNTLVLGRFVLVATDGGITFLSGHNERALTDEYSAEGPIFDALYTENLDEVSRDKRAYQLAFQFIIQNPGLEVQLMGHKFFNFFKDDISGFTYNDLSSINPLPDWLVNSAKGIAEIYYLLVLGLAVTSLFLKRYPQDRWFFILLMFILGWTAFHLAFYGKDRFRLPVTPALAQLAAVSVLSIWDRYSNRLRRKSVELVS